MRNNKTTQMVLSSLLAAIIIIMSVTPLGYIPLVVVNATIIHVPVILGALFCGPKQGAILGFVFGFTSFMKNTIMPTSLSAFVFSPVLAGSMIGPVGIYKSTFICFVPRILVGVVPYFVYIAVKKYGKMIAFSCAGIVGTMVNTILVMGSIWVLYKDAYAKALNIAPEAVLAAISSVIGFNGVVEAIIAAVLVSGVGVVLHKIQPIQSGKKL
uniref:ECF transporter S component n=1 Tax=Acetatifactor sp. TaxID=1872090 RepID=UPI004056EFDE